MLSVDMEAGYAWQPNHQHHYNHWLKLQWIPWPSFCVNNIARLMELEL